MWICDCLNHQKRGESGLKWLWMWWTELLMPGLHPIWVFHKILTGWDFHTVSTVSVGDWWQEIKTTSTEQQQLCEGNSHVWGQRSAADRKATPKRLIKSERQKLLFSFFSSLRRALRANEQSSVLAAAHPSPRMWSRDPNGSVTPALEAPAMWLRLDKSRLIVCGCLWVQRQILGSKD